jgi:predicted esterase
MNNRSLKPPHLDDARAEDEEGILASVNKIHDIVDQEAAHVPENRIVVGGFSQGAAVTLLTSLTTEKKVSRVSRSTATCELGVE